MESVPSHFHTTDRIAEKDLIPDGDIVSVVPDWAAPEGSQVTYLNGATFRRYRMVSGTWRIVGSEAVTDATISVTDITNNNVNSNEHGWAPKSPGDPATFLNGGTTPDWTVPPDTAGRLYTTTTPVTVTNTTTETDLISYLVPADTMGTLNILHAKLFFSNFSGTGAGFTATFKVKWGNTTLLTTGAFDPASSTMDGWIDIYVMATGAINSLNCNCETRFITVNGNLSPVTNALVAQDLDIETPAAGTTTTDQTFKVTVTWSVATVNNSITLANGFIEIIK